jgi:uncharacterized protein (TIGR03435 family)
MRFATLLATVLVAPAVRPQSLKPQGFLIVSIKPNQSGADDNSMRTSPGRLTVVNMTAHDLLGYGFGVKDSRLVGEPDWFSKDTFDIEAITGTAADLNRATLQPLLQAMFADRFGLKFHREDRESPVYSMVVAKGGAKLVAHAGGGESGAQIHARGGKNLVNATKTTMKRLAEVLSEQTDRFVIDNTGLGGEYDFSLAWDENPTADSAEVSVFTAIQEQLGLKLEAWKGPVPVMVIDRVAKPTEN